MCLGPKLQSLSLTSLLALSSQPGHVPAATGLRAFLLFLLFRFTQSGFPSALVKSLPAEVAVLFFKAIQPKSPLLLLLVPVDLV